MPAYNLGIVIPTYNEKDNINNLLNQLNTVASDLQIRILVLVVDDNSPDGTAKIIQEAIENLKNNSFLEIRMLNRTGKLGLASAYKQGFLMIKPEVEYLMSMDADLSHNPKYIANFLEKGREQNDLVIGSRYVDGGGVENWGMTRMFISRGGSLYSRTILGIDIQDFTGGYNMYKANLFDSFDLHSIKAEGYLFQIEMKYRLAKLGTKWSETPILFVDRKEGKSKMSKKIFAEAIFGVVKLRFGKA